MMVFLLKWKLQKQKALLAEVLLSTSRLKDDLENIRKYQSRQQAAVNDVLSAGFCLIDPILKESYSLPANSPHTSKEFLNLLNIQIATMRSGEYIDRLKTSINNYRPDLIAEIEQTLPKLKKTICILYCFISRACPLPRYAFFSASQKRLSIHAGDVCAPESPNLMVPAQRNCKNS